MKRSVSMFLIMVLVLSMLAFAGCTSKTPSTEAPAASEPSVEKTKVKFAVQADSTKALESIVTAFNQKSEQYEVEAIILTNDSGNMHDQIVNSLSSKSGEYDVISMDVVWAGEFAAAGYLEPLDTFIKDAGWKPADFNAGSISSGKYKGKHYALPYFSDLGFLYYRKDIVSEEDAQKLAGADYTYEDLFAMAEKYAGKGGTKYSYVYQSSQYEGLTCNVNEFTNNWTDLENGLKMMKAFTDSKVTPDNILVYTEGETHNAFLNGESVFGRNWPYMNGMAASGDYTVGTDKIGYAALPNGGTVGGWILGINVNSKNMEGAKAFLAFLAGPEGQTINATVGSYLPGYNALMKDSQVLQANALLTDEAFQKALQSTIARPVVANYSEVSDVIQLKAHEFLSGNGKLEDAVKSIQEKLQQ
ncbi:extracellular solute-binding protein [Geosporobacter ferrireducens]|uniref:ABC transporter substrate-binding protein n=1 Tax=Geosporobacter ferrireducens TaxID=1424294 RepID=A0A1D8GEH6_9FIRM|nr:extracellular solute-binding protein [Geosporobacter ferrireducens]AOT69303.1 ABC transporter substrate-binding protein [Geosporobacter ferrireducens]MTI56987.1 extracellular solute-binding protein [Geosporobacter ferrireducens]